MIADAFHGQVVIVTYASARIGKALASQLAPQGAMAAVTARRVRYFPEVKGFNLLAV